MVLYTTEIDKDDGNNDSSVQFDLRRTHYS